MIGPKTLLIAVGGRGEVEPFLALARGLTAAGHGAVVAGPRRFATLAAEVGVEFVGLDDSVFTLRRELGRAGIGGRRSPYLTEPDLLSWLDGLTQLVRIGPDAVLFTQGAVGAASLADHLGVPALPAQLVPTAPATSAFAAPSAARSTPHALHRWSWGNSGSAPHLWRSVVARWRIRQLGLSPHEVGLTHRVAEHGVLSGWSRHLLPAPSDWPSCAAPVGFWSLPADAGPTLPSDLTNFLCAGEPPVLIVLPDLCQPDTKPAVRTITQALRTTGRRGLLVAGRSGLGSGPVCDQVYATDRIHLAVALPHVMAVVHRGGIGVTAATTTAGVPQVTLPVTEAQRFWADRLHRRGVTPEPLGRLTPRGLADALSRARTLLPAAASLRTLMLVEDGISTARGRIERARSATRPR